MSENKRMQDIAKGMKTGAVKEGINSVVTPISDTLKDTFIEKFGKDDPIVEVFADAGSRFAVLLLFAEMLGLLGQQFDGIIDEADEKSQLLARYLRKLAGEELGEKGVHLLFEALPSVGNLFNNIKTEDIKYALGEKSVVYTSEIPELFGENVAEETEAVHKEEKSEQSFEEHIKLEKE